MKLVLTFILHGVVLFRAPSKDMAWIQAFNKQTYILQIIYKVALFMQLQLFSHNLISDFLIIVHSIVNSGRQIFNNDFSKLSFEHIPN